MCQKCTYTPVNSNSYRDIEDIAQRQTEAAEHFRKAFEAMGFDLKDPNMRDTPKRVAKMYMQELFKGTWTNPPVITTFDLPPETIPTQLITVGPITVKSLCSHHLMPIDGYAWIGVVFGSEGIKGVPGLSKYARVVDHYSRRPQIQEQLTKQIHDHLVSEIGLDVDPAHADKNSFGGLAVVIKAKHFCMSHRGVGESESWMTTSEISGKFRNGTLRQEFLSEIPHSRDL